jgi:plastocyanin
MSEPRRLSAVAIAAALVLGACGGGGSESSTDSKAEQPTERTETPAADIVLTGTNALDYEPSRVEAAAGTISVALSSDGGPHTFTVELDDGAETVAQVFSSAQVGTGEIELEAGTYTFYCVIAGPPPYETHRDGGMEGTLTVT